LQEIQRSVLVSGIDVAAVEDGEEEAVLDGSKVEL